AGQSRRQAAAGQCPAGETTTGNAPGSRNYYRRQVILLLVCSARPGTRSKKKGRCSFISNRFGVVAGTLWRREFAYPSTFRRHKAIPNARLCEKVAWMGRVGLQLLAQAVDIHAQVLGLAAIFRSPDALQQRTMREHL